MDQDFFTYLPSDIVMGILSRLPIRTILRCRYVCKSWLDLISTPQFDKLHRSKSVCGLAILDSEKLLEPSKLIEFVDEDDLSCEDHCWNPVWNFSLPFHRSVHSLVHSSANGLLFLYQEGLFASELFICNPITREYIIIPPPPSSKLVHRLETFGFGVGRLTDEYKLVRIIHDDLRRPPWFEYVPFECQVYTVGSGLWRRVASGSPLEYAEYSVGAFLNGNLHWMASNGSSVQISCLDLDTELFSTFSPPPRNGPGRATNLSVLENCLCLCDSSAYEGSDFYEIDIWFMKEYGDETSWTKDFVVRKVDEYPSPRLIFPIKVFKNGDILMASRSFKLLYYSNKTNTVVEDAEYPVFDSRIFSCRTIFFPRFLPLNSFKMELVCSF